MPAQPPRPGRPERRPGKPDRFGKPERPGRPERPNRPERSDRPRRPGSHDAPPRRRPADAPEAASTLRAPRLRAPELPPDITAQDLDRSVRGELRSLPTELADKIAVHLVAAGLVLDDDPDAARAHAWYARSLAPRLAVVREAAGVTAYATGDYASALTELRAVRRMTGDPSHLPVMADCERGLGRPERALALGRETEDVRRLDTAARVELAIVLSGARRDLGEYDAAVVGLQGAALDRSDAQPWTVRLWYAYADALLAAGRTADAVAWFEATAAADDEGETDADERAARLRSPD